MIPINQTDVTNITKQSDAKVKPGRDNPVLYRLHAASLTNMIDLIRNFSEYEMAHFINNNERWIANRGKNTSTAFKRGDILMIDLGAHNFRNEPSFPHPCIVLHQNFSTLLIVPCSSKKYGTGYAEIVDATISDGFRVNTGIQTSSYRWVNKNRVMNRMGTASSRVMKEIDSKLLTPIPSHRLMINQKKHELNNVTLQLENANTQIAKLKESNRAKDALINQLKEQLINQLKEQLDI